jgi:CRP-like cAMP-binding protein
MATQQLAGQEIFQFLRSEQVDRIHDAAEEIAFKAGETVYHQGERADHFFIVLEGQVALRLQPEKGVSLLIDELRKGEVFGSCVCLQMDSYALTAQCTLDSKVLSVRAATLKKLMDEDLVMGYATQTLISQVYFKRYIDTMKKLQAVVHAIPLEAI